MTHQEILFDVVSQTIYFDPPEGQASGTPTVEVFATDTDDDGTAESAAGACSVDSVATTFSASVGDVEITVADGTGITRGRRYLVADTDGDSEWVECISKTGTTVGLRHPLKNSYQASSTFKGCRISATIDSTWVADENNITDPFFDSGIPGATGYRCRWSYTVDSVARIGVSYFDLVRYQAKNLVTPLDVDRRFPGWIDRLPTDYQRDQGQSLVEEAFSSVKMDALRDGQVVRRIRETQVVRELTIYRANVLAQEAALFSGGSNAEMVNAAQALYEQRYKTLIREPKVPVDPDGSGASAQADRLPAFRR